jgi:hypothetical protein
MLQCYVLTCGRSVTAFLAPPRSQRPWQGPRSPHPKAGPGFHPFNTLFFGACCKRGGHLYINTAPSCCIPASYCHLSATLQTMSNSVANLQENRAVFRIFIALLKFLFESPSYIQFTIMYLLCTALHKLQAFLTCDIFISTHVLFNYSIVNFDQDVCDY